MTSLLQLECIQPGVSHSYSFQVFQGEVNWLWTTSQDVTAVKTYVTSRESTTAHFLLQAGESKIPGFFFRRGHLFLFYCTGFIHCHSSEDNSPSDQCLQRSGFGGNTYITGMFCFNSTPSWKPEPDSGISLRNTSETCSQASTLTAKLLKGLRFHLLKYRKPL